MIISFEGKVALVTGAAMGMGFAAAENFAKLGASVVLADINLKKVQAAADVLAARGYQVTAISCDVSDDKQVKAMVDRTVEVYGRLDAAYNNAGIQAPFAQTADVEEIDYDRLMNINLKGIWLCMKYELQQMMKQGSGTIVNCSSLGGLVGAAGRSPYHATKHGILGMTKSAALEYACKGIRINAVCPGTIQTPMVEEMIKTGALDETASKKLIPIGRLGKASEVADAVIWLCSDMSTYVIGQSISVDGGYTIQ